MKVPERLPLPAVNGDESVGAVGSANSVYVVITPEPFTAMSIVDCQ